MDDSFATGYALGNDNDKRDGGMMGGEGGFLVLIILFALFSGNGFGGMGGNKSGDFATKSDLCESFNFNQLENGVRGIQNGICDSTFALNNSLTNGFNNIGNGISNLGYQMQNCCCENLRAIDGVNYNMSKGFCDVIQNAHNDADRIINVLTQDKIESLRTELQSAQLQLSNAAQTTAIVNQIRPCPIPAYPACNPWATQSNCGCC